MTELEVDCFKTGRAHGREGVTKQIYWWRRWCNAS